MRRIRSDSFRFVFCFQIRSPDPTTPPRKGKNGKRIRDRRSQAISGKTLASDHGPVCNGARPASAPTELPAMRRSVSIALLAIFFVAAQPPRRPGAPRLTTAEVKTADYVYKHTPQGDLKLHFYQPADW